MPNQNWLEEQLIELQSRMAFQEDTVQQLNQVIAEQDVYIRKLQEQIQALIKRVEDVSYAADSQGGKPVDERPPHY